MHMDISFHSRSGERQGARSFEDDKEGGEGCRTEEIIGVEQRVGSRGAS